MPPPAAQSWYCTLEQSKSGPLNPLEKEMATHSSILAWKIPWIEKLGGLRFMGSQRVGHNRATKAYTLNKLGDE